MQKDVVLCKDCKHFKKDAWGEINGIPLIVAHKVCMFWCGGCKTREDGFCFMGVKRNEPEE